jgi:spore coat protein U-like protein
MKLRALKLAAMSAAAACALYPGGADAQTVNSTVTVVVDNTLTLNVANNMHFGSIVAFGQTGAGVAATLELNADGTFTGPTNGVGANDGRIEILDNTLAQQTVITIADGVPNATINVTVDNVVDPTDGATSLTLQNFEQSHALAGTAALTVATPFTVTLTATGTNTLNIGAEIATQIASYADATYTGSFDVTFSY